MAALPQYTVGALNWQLAANGTTDLIAAFVVDLASYSAWIFTPYAIVQGTTTATRYADGVVVDNMDGVADVYVLAGLVLSKVPRYQKAVIPLATGSQTVTITGAGTPRVYFYAGTFHGQTDNVSFYSVQQMAAQSTITSGNIDAYLQTIRWKFNFNLAAGSNLDNLTDSGFYDVLNPTSPASGNLPAGTWSVTATTYSQSNLATYQLARNILSPDTQVFERRQTVANGWTPWRNVGLMVTGQCQFQNVDTKNGKLVPLGGGLLIVNGNVETVPYNNGNGVPFVNTLTNVAGGAAMANSTDYYAYVYMNNGAMVGEWSTTVWGLDNRGQPIKSGDATRTYIGRVRTTASGVFADSSTQRLWSSYFNKRRKTLSLVTSTGTASSSMVVMAATLIEFVIDKQAVGVKVSGYGTPNTGNLTIAVQSNLNGAFVGQAVYGTVYGNNWAMPTPINETYDMNDGYNTYQVGGLNNNSYYTTWNIAINAEVWQ